MGGAYVDGIGKDFQNKATYTLFLRVTISFDNSSIVFLSRVMRQNCCNREGPVVSLHF